MQGGNRGGASRAAVYYRVAALARFTPRPDSSYRLTADLLSTETITYPLHPTTSEQFTESKAYF
jgi:hypothetical protein